MTAAQSNIIPFAFEDHLVRVYKPNGEPWFVGKDVCAVLEIGNHNQALKRLDDDERSTCTVGTPSKGVHSSDPLSAAGNEQTMVVVSEAGVFRLIFSSRKAEAERFKRWLAHEVLPQLRRHGFYAIEGGRPGEHDPGPVLEFPHGDEAISIHMAKLATLKECRMIHGPRAAARLWRRLGMPQVTESIVEEVDEGRECLAYLLNTSGLAAPVLPDEIGTFLIRNIVDSALNEVEQSEKILRERFGLLVLPGPNEGLFVPNSYFKTLTIFKNSRWAKGRHMQALRRLPGAQPMAKSVHGQVRGTFVPAALIDSIPLTADVGEPAFRAK